MCCSPANTGSILAHRSSSSTFSRVQFCATTSLSRSLMGMGLLSSPLNLLHRHWGVFIPMVIAGFPFTFLLALSYLSGLDPALERWPRSKRSPAQ